MNNEKFKRYITYTITLLKKRAREAKRDADNPKSGFEAYTQGIIMGYYSIITILKQQAFAFCIDQKELGLADIEPDIDLLGFHRNPDIDFGEDNWMIEVMNEEKVKGYLSDSIALLKEEARDARKDARNSKEGSENYNKGLVLAYYSVLSLLKHQTLAFNIDEKELGLADIDLEAYLLDFLLNDFIDIFTRISSKDYQIRIWINGKGPQVNDFNDTVNNLFLECDFILENYKDFGIIDNQYHMLKNFQDKFRAFSDKNSLPTEFIDTPEWEEIVEMAKEILKTFNYKKVRTYTQNN